MTCSFRTCNEPESTPLHSDGAHYRQYNDVEDTAGTTELRSTRKLPDYRTIKRGRPLWKQQAATASAQAHNRVLLRRSVPSKARQTKGTLIAAQAQAKCIAIITVTHSARAPALPHNPSASSSPASASALAEVQRTPTFRHTCLVAQPAHFLPPRPCLPLFARSLSDIPALPHRVGAQLPDRVGSQLPVAQHLVRFSTRAACASASCRAVQLKRRAHAIKQPRACLPAILYEHHDTGTYRCIPVHTGLL